MPNQILFCNLAMTKDGDGVQVKRNYDRRTDRVNSFTLCPIFARKYRDLNNLEQAQFPKCFILDMQQNDFLKKHKSKTFLM